MFWLLIVHWKDCVLRGFKSFFGLGTVALLVIIWSCFLSLTSMSCLLYVLLSMVSLCLFDVVCSKVDYDCRVCDCLVVIWGVWDC